MTSHSASPVTGGREASRLEVKVGQGVVGGEGIAESVMSPMGKRSSHLNLTSFQFVPVVQAMYLDCPSIHWVNAKIPVNAPFPAGAKQWQCVIWFSRIINHQRSPMAQYGPRPAICRVFWWPDEHCMNAIYHVYRQV